jgi:hypothetical protein
VVSLDMAYCSFREVMAGLDTRLDTPPSIDSRGRQGRRGRLDPPAPQGPKGWLAPKARKVCRAQPALPDQPAPRGRPGRLSFTGATGASAGYVVRGNLVENWGMVTATSGGVAITGLGPDRDDVGGHGNTAGRDKRDNDRRNHHWQRTSLLAGDRKLRVKTQPGRRHCTRHAG